MVNKVDAHCCLESMEGIDSGTGEGDENFVGRGLIWIVHGEELCKREDMGKERLTVDV